MARPEAKLTSLKERQDRYLAARAKHGSLARSCRAARVSHNTVYDWRDPAKDAERPDGYPAETFVELEKRAHQEYCDRLEAEAHRRGVEGVRRGVYYRGKLVAVEREYSDTLLLALMNAHMPEKYGRQRHEHTGPGGGPMRLKLDLVRDGGDG